MDHYRVLQVTREAEPEVIDRAYRALSRKYHPDLGTAGDREMRTTRMQSINEAYRVLRDPARRSRYDARLGPAHPSAWEQFLERGLVGLFVDAVRARERS
jgi:curved DNA-binding protein